MKYGVFSRRDDNDQKKSIAMEDSLKWNSVKDCFTATAKPSGHHAPPFQRSRSKENAWTIDRRVNLQRNESGELEKSPLAGGGRIDPNGIGSSNEREEEKLTKVIY